jgi:hypothetical protein
VAVLINTSALAQRGDRQDVPPPASVTATVIPGVVAAGTKIELVKSGQWGAENDNIRHPQNLAFGGPDRKTLYIVGAATIYKVRSPTK